MPDVDMLDKLAKIGQLINGIGVASAAVTAWVTFLFFQRRERDNRWIDGFRTLYSEYWKDKQIVEARRWIINDQLYDSILRPALRARLATGEKRNTLSQAQNEVLEKIDLL